MLLLVSRLHDEFARPRQHRFRIDFFTERLREHIGVLRRQLFALSHTTHHLIDEFLRSRAALFQTRLHPLSSVVHVPNIVTRGIRIHLRQESIVRPLIPPCRSSLVFYPEHPPTILSALRGHRFLLRHAFARGGFTRVAFGAFALVSRPRRRRERPPTRRVLAHKHLSRARAHADRAFASCARWIRGRTRGRAAGDRRDVARRRVGVRARGR